MNYQWYATPQQYDLALSNGISNSILNNRIHEYGWSIDRACNEPLHRQGMKNIINDEIRQTLKDNNISLKTYRARVLRLGWSVERAMNTTTMNKIESINLAIDKRRRISKKEYGIAEKNGIKKTTLQCRVKRGWSVEKAISTKTMTNTERAKCGYFHKEMKLFFSQV